MNLPAHGTTSPDPSIASLLKLNTTQVTVCWISAWRNTKRRQAKLVQTAWRYSPLRQAPDLHATPVLSAIAWRLPLTTRRHSHTDPLLWRLLPGGSHSAARCTRDSIPPLLRLSPGAPTVSPGAISETTLYWFLAPQLV
ncbi:hypothetical protein DEO72_LG4g18 [Vigna unguiculata]|uniref:Uncharacterized protein n=1 Tax=Vigna unguiculata TaxID=3917 RepID=A0A4D6LKN5_VIGUN|nr:hypothetical protein DEO72_LG4g18 [Vigna unguiculata]